MHDLSLGGLKHVMIFDLHLNKFRLFMILVLGSITADWLRICTLSDLAMTFGSGSSWWIFSCVSGSDNNCWLIH
mgnify:CR=1 FL=1